MVEGAIHSGGVALAPARMFARELREGLLQRLLSAEADLWRLLANPTRNRAI